jgi:hypothetical protein
MAVCPETSKKNQQSSVYATINGFKTLKQTEFITIGEKGAEWRKSCLS